MIVYCRMYFKSIQLLRAVAAIIVTFFHVIYWWGLQKDNIAGIFDRGYGAIDLFFVISGFVVFQSAQRSKIGLSHFLLFLKKRLIRIYPFYWVVLVPVLLTGAFQREHWTAWQFGKSLFLLPGFTPIIGPTWTLQYEIYFYLLISLYVLDKRLRPLLSILFLLSVIAVSTNLAAIPSFHFPMLGVYNEFVLEFFLGTLAFRFYRYFSRGWAFFLVAAGLILVFFPLTRQFSHLLTFGIPCMFLITGLTSLESSRKFVIPRPFLLAGDASYCLYLIHAPIMRAILPDPSSAVPISRLLILAEVTAIIALSIPIHLYIEKPLLRYLNEKTNFT